MYISFLTFSFKYAFPTIRCLSFCLKNYHQQRREICVFNGTADKTSLILTSILASQIVDYRGGKTLQIWTPGMLDL